MHLTKALSVLLALLGVAAIGATVPLLDAFAQARYEGGILLVLSFLVLLLGLGAWLLIVAWRLYKRSK